MIKRTAKIMLAHIDYLHGGLCELAMDLSHLITICLYSSVILRLKGLSLWILLDIIGLHLKQSLE